MERKTTVVIQGSYRSETTEVIQNYIRSEIFDKVIYSGRTDEASIVRSHWLSPHMPEITKILSDPPKNCGVGNRNIQITSTNAGLSQVETPYVWKVRSDQILPVSTIKYINNFIHDHEHSSRAIGQEFVHMQGPIFVAGNYRAFPFHPRDHMFIGHTKDIKDLFDIPLDYVSESTDYSKWLRAEAWIGANYLAKYSFQIKHMLRDFQKYLVDNAPSIGYAREVSERITPKAFKTLPRIDFSWPKHGLRAYHYHVGQSLSEYWHE